MRSLCTALVIAAIAAPMPAQDRAAKERSREARALYDKLDADYMRRMQQGYNVETDPLNDYVGLFQAVAKDYAGTDEAVPFLAWIAARASRGRRHNDAVIQAMKELIPHYVESPELVRVTARWGTVARTLGEQAKAMERMILKHSPHKEVKAALYLSVAEYVTSRHQARAPEKERTLAIANFKKAQELMPEGIELQRRATSGLFQLTRLQIGMESPDIVGEDLDGMEFKLSDYRGKVVVLDFWGDW